MVPARKKESLFSGIGVLDFSRRNSAASIDIPCFSRKAAKQSWSFKPGTVLT